MLALQSCALLMFEIFFVSVISQYIINLSKKMNNQTDFEFMLLTFFYCASPIAMINMSLNYFPNDLLISNCFISVTALYLILKHSVSLAMSKGIIQLGLFQQIFLLVILMTGSIFSFANFNYSINIVLGNNATNIKVVDYIFLYSSIFTLNYDGLVLQTGIDKFLASISMIYAYCFISIVFTTIITRLNNNIVSSE